MGSGVNVTPTGEYAQWNAGLVWDGTGFVYAPGGPAFSDAFGRQRVSEPQSLFSGKNILDNQPLIFDDQEVSGGSTGSSWDQDKASVTLSVAETTAGLRVRQSKTRPTYQPGKSQRAFITFTAGESETGIYREVGLFDDNNGIFLRQTPAGLSFVRRSNRTGTPAETEVAQASWNADVMPDLDITKAQILYIDFEWLGVGIVRVGFVIDGIIRIAHVFAHANAAAGVYMSTPNLPVRYSLENDGTGGAATFECICSGVDSEGGLDDVGVNFSINRAATPLTTGANTSIYPLLAIRLDSAGLDAFVRPIDFSILCTTTANYLWSLLLNPTLAGTALSWADVGNSAVERAIPTNATTVTSNGTVLASGYSADTNQSRGTAVSDIGQFQLGSAIDGTSDVIVLAVQNLAAAAEDYYAALTWRESA